MWIAMVHALARKAEESAMVGLVRHMNGNAELMRQGAPRSAQGSTWGGVQREPARDGSSLSWRLTDKLDSST